MFIIWSYLPLNLASWNKTADTEAKQDCSFLSSTKFHKLFSKINDSVKSSLQKWIIPHPHVIKYPVANDYITVKFDDVNGVVNTELCQKSSSPCICL